VAIGTAATLAAADLADGAHQRLAVLRDRLHQRLTANLGARALLNGHPDRRLPNTLNVAITGIAAHDLLTAIPGLAASTGSACHSGHHQPSPVLTAMGQPAMRALAALRLSLGRWSTVDEVDHAADLLTTAIRRLPATVTDPG
jgi:cysteine desulfurase